MPAVDEVNSPLPPDHAARRSVVSIELLLDDDLDAQVREDWRRLADARMSSLGAYTSPTHRPHVTLLVRPELATLAFADAVDQLPVRLTLGAPMMFRHGGDRGILVRPVEDATELTRLHRTVHAAAGDGEDAAHTAPEDWSPHVTLARRLKATELEAATAMLPAALHGRGTALRRWDSASATVTPLS